jgi:hypothetical protein
MSVAAESNEESSTTNVELDRSTGRRELISLLLLLLLLLGEEEGGEEVGEATAADRTIAAARNSHGKKTRIYADVDERDSSRISC